MSTPVARRYAGALYDEAEHQRQLEEVDADFALISGTLDGSPELVRLFESPIVSRERKLRVLEALFGERLQPITHRFLRLLIENQRETIFPAIVRAYRMIRDEKLGIVEAAARVAFLLERDDETRLTRALERLIGKQIRLSVTLDHSLIGGVVVRVGDTVYDGSIRHQLSSLRDVMMRQIAHTNGT
jgi:F-type H+-transporting ATPase subunit delta